MWEQLPLLNMYLLQFETISHTCGWKIEFGKWRMSNNALDLKTEIMIGYIAVYYAAIVTNKSSVNLPRILFKQVLKFGHASMNLPFVFKIILWLKRPKVRSKNLNWAHRKIVRTKNPTPRKDSKNLTLRPQKPRIKKPMSHEPYTLKTWDLKNLGTPKYVRPKKPKTINLYDPKPKTQKI